VLPRAELERIWNPEHLERLARTYWRFLTRITLGLIRIEYTETQRTVVLVCAPLRLLRFRAPEYEMDAQRAMVRWRIEDGLLVAARGRGGNGYLEIEVERRGPVADGAVPEPDSERLRVKVEVASFYPAIASRLSRWVYENTQSRIHVLVTQGFLRSLAALDLAESKVGRLAGVDQVPGTRVAGGGAAGRPASAPELRSGRAAR
jgi:hypothetical protein